MTSTWTTIMKIQKTFSSNSEKCVISSVFLYVLRQKSWESLYSSILSVKYGMSMVNLHHEKVYITSLCVISPFYGMQGGSDREGKLDLKKRACPNKASDAIKETLKKYLFHSKKLYYWSGLVCSIHLIGCIILKGRSLP